MKITDYLLSTSDNTLHLTSFTKHGFKLMLDSYNEEEITLTYEQLEKIYAHVKEVKEHCEKDLIIDQLTEKVSELLLKLDVESARNTALIALPISSRLPTDEG